MLKSVLASWRKTLYTSIPGIVVDYDANTKRARVQPAIQFLRRGNDDATTPQEVVDVPVMFPGGGGWMLAVEELAQGDAVMLIFCQRGIGRFKRTYSVELTSGGVMQKDAAVAIPAFSPQSINPPSGIAMQNQDGSIKVQVSDDGVEVAVGESGGATFNSDGSVDFANGAKSTITGDFITALGTSLDLHVHTGGTLTGGFTGSPV